MPLYSAHSGDLDRCYWCLTDWLTTLKDIATQLLLPIRVFVTCSATDGGMTTNLEHGSEKLPDIGHNSGLPKICPFYCPPLMDATMKPKCSLHSHQKDEQWLRTHYCQRWVKKFWINNYNENFQNLLRHLEAFLLAIINPAQRFLFTKSQKFNLTAATRSGRSSMALIL